MAVTVADFTLTGFAFPVGSGITSCDYPAEADVRLGVAYDDGDSVGTMTLPTEGQVELGVGYGSGGTEFTGTLFVPGGLVTPTDDLLLHSPADILRTALVALGQGTEPSSHGAWPLFATGEPSSPDNAVTVFDTQGGSDGRAMGSGELFQHWGVQVRVRSVDHATGWHKTGAIRYALSTGCYQQGVVMTDSTTYLIHAVTNIGEVVALGKEVPSSKRNLFTLNAKVSVKRVS